MTKLKRVGTDFQRVPIVQPAEIDFTDLDQPVQDQPTLISDVRTGDVLEKIQQQLNPPIQVSFGDWDLIRVGILSGCGFWIVTAILAVVASACASLTGLNLFF